MRNRAQPAIRAPTIRPDQDIVPIESLLYEPEPAAPLDETPVVPIESLAPEAEVPRPHPRPHPQPRLPAGSSAATGPTIGFGEIGRRPRPVSSDCWVPRSGPQDIETVEIGVLCYRGRAALERAAAVRQQLADELERHGGFDSIRPLLQELLDLVPLALVES